MPFYFTHSPSPIAHRGHTLLHPENTLPAFRAALSLGARALETDVHLSLDGEVVLHHDATLDRCFSDDGNEKGNRHVGVYEWADLARLRRRGGGEGMARLDGLLELLAMEGEGVWVLLDLKLDDDPVHLLTQIRATIASAPPADWPARIVLACWTHAHMRAAAAILPGYAIAYTCWSPVAALAVLRHSSLSNTLSTTLSNTSNNDEISPHMLNMPVQSLVGPLGTRLLRTAKEKNIYITAWTARGDSWMQWCATNLPAHVGVICEDVGAYTTISNQIQDKGYKTPWWLYATALRAQAVITIAMAIVRLAGGTYDGVAMHYMNRRQKRAREGVARAVAERAAGVVRREVDK